MLQCRQHEEKEHPLYAVRLREQAMNEPQAGHLNDPSSKPGSGVIHGERAFDYWLATEMSAPLAGLQAGDTQHPDLNREKIFLGHDFKLANEAFAFAMQGFFKAGFALTRLSPDANVYVAYAEGYYTTLELITIPHN